MSIAGEEDCDCRCRRMRKVMGDPMKKFIALFALSCVPWVSGYMPCPIAAQENQKNAADSIFLVIYRPGPSWVPGKTVHEQRLKEHGKYMLSLYEKGSMKSAGPFTDNTGGAVVLEVNGDTEARAIVAEDPAVKSGVFLPEIHPWALVPWDKILKK
jgi:uncharacterized protein